MTAPQRIQRKRTKGWRMPEGAVYVGRPSKWGNPFRAVKSECCGYWDVRDDNGVTYLVDHAYVHQAHVRANSATWTTWEEATREAVRLYRDCLATGLLADPWLVRDVPELAGKNLACWCPLDQPCHADVLLEIANGADS